MDLLPESIAFPALAVLLVRGFLMAVPRIVDAISKALVEREQAKRLTAQAHLAEVEDRAASDKKREHEIETLRASVEQLRTSIVETERMASEALHAREVDHAATRERLDVCEREHATTKRQMNALHQEMRALRAEMTR